MQSWKVCESSDEKIFFYSNFYHLFTSFQLWKTSQPNDFTFADPLMRETPTEYNSLHDPNLRTFFMRKAHLDVSGICITNQPSKSLHLRSILILSLNSICVETTSSRIVTRSFARWRMLTIIANICIAWELKLKLLKRGTRTSTTWIVIDWRYRVVCSRRSMTRTGSSAKCIRRVAVAQQPRIRRSTKACWRRWSAESWSENANERWSKIIFVLGFAW